MPIPKLTVTSPGPPVLNRRMHPFAVLMSQTHYARFSNLTLAIDVVLFFQDRDPDTGPDSVVDEVTGKTYDVFDCKRERNRNTQPGMVAVTEIRPKSDNGNSSLRRFGYAY